MGSHPILQAVSGLFNFMWRAAYARLGTPVLSNHLTKKMLDLYYRLGIILIMSGRIEGLIKMLPLLRAGHRRGCSGCCTYCCSGCST
jgi:hypothetical protein